MPKLGRRTNAWRVNSARAKRRIEALDRPFQPMVGLDATMPHLPAAVGGSGPPPHARAGALGGAGSGVEVPSQGADRARSAYRAVVSAARPAIGDRRRALPTSSHTMTARSILERAAHDLRCARCCGGQHHAGGQ
jgi:hypothetical protein